MANVQTVEPLSLPTLHRDDRRYHAAPLSQSVHKGPHSAGNLAHYHISDSLCAHHSEHQVENEPMTHQPVRSLSHNLRVLQFDTNLVLPSLLIARQRSLVFKISQGCLSCKMSRYHRGLYPSTVCRHN